VRKSKLLVKINEEAKERRDELGDRDVNEIVLFAGCTDCFLSMHVRLPRAPAREYNPSLFIIICRGISLTNR